MRISLQNPLQEELFSAQEIMNSDSIESGIYLSTLKEFRGDYSFIAIVKDVMGDCIGLATTPTGDSYVFNNIMKSVEFEGDFYRSESGLSIDP